MCVTQMSQKFNGQMLLALIETEPPALCLRFLLLLLRATTT